MGRGMVKNLVEKGNFSGPVVIYNRTFSVTEKLVSGLESSKAKAVKTIPEVVKESDIIFTIVSNDAAVEETIDAALAVPESKGKLFVESSTIHPDVTNKLAERVTNAGAQFIACPVFGAPAMADNGQLVAVPAGPKQLIDRVQPFLKDVTSRAVIDFPDQPTGTATHLKIVGNTFVLHMIESLSEGFVLAEKSGLGNENLAKFIDTMFPGPYAAYSKRMRSGDYWDRDYPLFTAKLARKDAGHAKHLAEQCGAKLKGLEVVDQHLKEVVDHAGDKGDIAGVYGAVRKESGLKFENK